MSNREAGRPSVFEPALISQIREGILAGKTCESIKEGLPISPSTWDKWYYENYNGFRDQLEGWRRDFKVKQAEDFSTRLMQHPNEEDVEFLRLKQKESEFLRETLASKVYSKKQGIDHTTNGKELPSPIIAIKRNEIPSDNSVQQDKPTA